MIRNVKPKKSLGQHFLNDKNIAARIVDSISYKGYSNLLEIGPGTGILTRELIKKKIPLIRIKNKIFKLGVHKIDYIKLLDINKLIKPYKKNKKYKIFIAYYNRKIRIIDNY